MTYIQNNTVFLIPCLGDKTPPPGKFRKGWFAATNNPTEKARFLNNYPLFGISCKLSNVIGIDIDWYKFYLLEDYQYSAEKGAITKEIISKGNVYFIYHSESKSFYIVFKAKTGRIITKKIIMNEFVPYLRKLHTSLPHQFYGAYQYKKNNQKYKLTRRLIACDERKTAEWIADYYDTERHSHNGYIQLIAFCNRFNLDDPSDHSSVWARTWQTITPSGGCHYLLQNTEEINQNALHKLGYPNLDLRWKGYLCNGNGYKIVNDVIPQAVPAELLEVLQAARAGTEEESGKYNAERSQLSNALPSSQTVYAPGTRVFYRAYIEKVLNGSANQLRNHKGNRNDMLNQLCFSLGRYLSENIRTPGYFKQQLFELFMMRMQAAALDAGLSDDETMKTILSGLEAGRAKPLEPAQHKPYKRVKK